jgi:branched-chain amino acid transport system substrate-binding protein
MMKRVARNTLRLTLAPMLVAGSFLTASAVQAADVIKFGTALPLTGPLATEGKKQQNGFEIWREIANARGGINVGGKKMKVEMIYYDYESKTPTATKLVERLITKDKVNILIGPFGSGATKAVAAIAERYKVPLIAPTASSEAVYDQGYKHLFGLLAPNAYLPTGFFETVSKLNPRPKSMAFVTRNDFFPKAITNMLRKASKNYGLKDVYYAEFPKDSKDMSTWLTVVKSKKPDILMVGGYVADLILATKQAKELGVNPKIVFMMAGPVYQQYADALGDTSNNVMSAAWWAETFKYKGRIIGSAAHFADLWQKKYNQIADYVGAASAAAGVVAHLAIEKAGSLEASKVIAAISSLKTETFFGPVEFNKGGQNIGSKIAIFQIQQQKRKTIYPLNISDGTLVYPRP